MRTSVRSIVPLLLILCLAVRPSAQSTVGVIGGTMVDTEGRPITGLTIVVAPASGSSAGVTHTAQTDSMGRYRVHIVSAGSYVVKAGGCPKGSSGQPCSMDAPIYVYHPGTTSSAKATVVRIDAGTSREDLNFVLSRATVTTLQQEGARLQAQASDLWRLRSYQPASTSTWRSLDEMHRYFVATFIATPGQGSGRMSGMLLQLDPKQRLLLPDEGSTSDASPQTNVHPWTVAQLDLIGIARHDRPVVFSRVAHGVYAQSERALTDIEQQSLAALQSAREIVSRSDGTGALLLIGAIRAESACLQCHRTEREGSLLGAFRYVLRPGTSREN